jgi:putative SOS response-associated peptidase YedK
MVRVSAEFPRWSVFVSGSRANRKSIGETRWDEWKNAEGQWIKTCSILTTAPNPVMATIHDRMPVILERESFDLWLDPGMQNVAAVYELLKPYDSRVMRSYPISTRVNHVANDDEDCSRPIELSESQNPLFA